MHTLGRGALAGALALGGALVAVGTTTVSASAVPPTVQTTVSANGWATTKEDPAYGSVGLVSRPGAPLGPDVVRMNTGPGSVSPSRGGKTYVLNNGYGNTAPGDVGDLAYSTYVEPNSNATVAPALNLSLRSNAGYQGNLVFEPYYQGTNPTQGVWQDWEPSAPGAVWWFSRDLYAPDNTTVLVPRAQGAPMQTFLDAFAANPTRYSNIRLDPNGGGLNVSLGQSAYDASFANITAYVDGVAIGTPTRSARRYDFVDGLGPCTADVQGTSYTLTEDCSTTTTITVPDGAEIDGDGHTITAVENQASPNFPGPVLASAVGDASAPASLDVRDLTIRGDFSGSNSGGALAGISMQRAGGSLTNVTVDRITHGNGVQEGNAIAIRNRVDATDLNVPRAEVVLDNVTATNYQKTGILLDGNLTFTASDLTVGRAGLPNGDPIPTGVTAANAVQISRSARGTLSDSTIDVNSYNDPNVSATSVLLYNTRRVTLARNVISGASGDEGIDISNDSNTLDTVATLTCNLVRSTGTPRSGSVGILVDEDAAPGAITTAITDTTVQGWATPVSGADPVTDAGECPPNAPEASATGGSKTVSVSWTPGAEVAYAPVTGYEISLLNAEAATVQTKQVAGNVTQTQFTDVAEGLDYTVQVTAMNVSGEASDTTGVSGTRFGSITATPRVNAGQSTTVSGSLVTVAGDPVPNADLVLQKMPQGETAWTQAATGTTGPDGSFSLQTQPTRRTAYRVLYAGNPYVSATSGTVRTNVAPLLTLAVAPNAGTVGSRVVFSGTVSAGVPNSDVVLQMRNNGTWVNMKNGRARNGEFSITYTLKNPKGVQSFRVVRLADARYAQGTSPTRQVTVS